MGVVTYTLSLKDRMSAALAKARGETDKLDRSVNHTEKSIKKLENASKSIGKNISSGIGSLGSALGITAGIGAAVSFGAAVKDSLVNYQYFSASLRTMMHGDAQQAMALQGQLVSLAKTTPFSLVEVQDATKQLIAYGFSAGGVVKNIKMLGDVASALKIPFSDIAYLYGTLKTQGRAMSKDIYQFTNRGIPIVAELAKHFKTTDDKVMKLVEDGKVGFKDVEAAFKSMTGAGGQFFGMMEEQNKTLGGKISAWGDSWEQLKVHIGQSQEGIMAGTVGFLSEATERLSQYFDKANIMSKNFAVNMASNFSWWQRLKHETIGVVTGYNYGQTDIVKAEMFQTRMYDKAKESEKSLIDAQKQKSQLAREQVYLVGLLASKQITSTEYLQKRATVKGAQAIVEGNIRLLSSKDKASTVSAESESSSSSASGGAGKASAPKYTQIHVNFENVVRELIIENKQGADLNKVADKVVELLALKINDSQRMALQ